MEAAESPPNTAEFSWEEDSLESGATSGDPYKRARLD